MLSILVEIYCLCRRPEKLHAPLFQDHAGCANPSHRVEIVGHEQDGGALVTQMFHPPGALGAENPETLPTRNGEAKIVERPEVALQRRGLRRTTDHLPDSFAQIDSARLPGIAFAYSPKFHRRAHSAGAGFLGRWRSRS